MSLYRRVLAILVGMVLALTLNAAPLMARADDTSSPPTSGAAAADADKAAKEKAEKEAKEAADKAAKEKAEKEAKEAADKAAKEKAVKTTSVVIPDPDASGYFTFTPVCGVGNDGVDQIVQNATITKQGWEQDSLGRWQYSTTYVADDGHTNAQGDDSWTVTKLEEDTSACDPGNPKDATADVTVTSPTCDAASVASVSGLKFAALVGTLDQSVGTHEATFNAESGHAFADGSTTRTVSYTIQAQLTGDQCETPVVVVSVPKGPQLVCTADGTFYDVTGYTYVPEYYGYPALWYKETKDFVFFISLDRREAAVIAREGTVFMIDGVPEFWYNYQTAPDKVCKPNEPTKPKPPVKDDSDKSVPSEKPGTGDDGVQFPWLVATFGLLFAASVSRFVARKRYSKN